jgi:hypothetical protein
MVDADYARHALRKIHTTMSGVKTAQGLLPHFMRMEGGDVVIHPGTEYSTVDTAIYTQSMLMAAHILEDRQTEDAVLEMIKRVRMTALLLPEGAISHGLKTDGKTLIPFAWRDWGGETALVMLLARMADANLDFAGMNMDGRAWQGTGFIAEIQSLLHPDFDSSTPDAVSKVNWRQARETMLRNQKEYFPKNMPTSFVARNGLYGLSAGEGYFGTSYEVGGFELQSQQLIHPHYILMSGTVEKNTQEVYDLLRRMEQAGYLTPWGLVENICVDGQRYLPMLGSLNAGFEVLGAYHLMAKHRNTEDIIYRASRDVPAIREAMKLFFPRAVATAGD